MMQSLASISPKSTPPPPHQHSHRHRHHRRQSMLAIRKDINPATYYDHTSIPRSPGSPQTTMPRTSTRSPVNGSSSCRNLLSHTNHSHHSHSVNTNNENNPIQQQQPPTTGHGSNSLMDLFAYTEQNFPLMDMGAFQIDEDNEFNNHDEFILNPNSSWSDLYAVMKTKHNKSNKKQYKNNKNKNNIYNYMKYTFENDGDGDGEYSDDEREGRDTLYIETESPLPPPTVFDSVNDIFNLIPDENDNNFTNEIKEFSTTATAAVYDELASENEAHNDGNEGAGNTNDTNEQKDFEKDKLRFNRLRKILNEYDMDNFSSDYNSDAVFTKIDTICQDLNDKKSKVRDIGHKYKDLQEFLNRLKHENETLKRKNDELVNKLTLTSITTDNVLNQLYEYLNELKGGIIESNNNNNNNTNMTSGSVINEFKMRLQSTTEALTDLANDLNCEVLKSAVVKVNKCIGDIEFLEHHKLYRISNLENIINDLLKDLNIKIKVKHTPDGSERMHSINEDKKYPEFVFDKEEKEFENDTNKIHSNKLTKYGIFDDEFPIVERIDIYGGWFNKKSRAVIKYKNEIFYRKEADFKWLYKMIKLNSDGKGCDIIPDYPKELPQVLWPNNYLTKRKSELNLFLMQCHSLKNINHGNPWNIFLENNKKNWKDKRDNYDKIMLKKIKQNQH